MTLLILIAAILPLLVGFAWARWSDPYRQDRNRARRQGATQDHWQNRDWPA